MRGLITIIYRTIIAIALAIIVAVCFLAYFYGLCVTIEDGIIANGQFIADGSNGVIYGFSKILFIVITMVFVVYFLMKKKCRKK